MKSIPLKFWRWKVAPLLQVLRGPKGEILVSRGIFGALVYPKHNLSAGKYHSKCTGDLLEEAVKFGWMTLH